MKVIINKNSINKLYIFKMFGIMMLALLLAGSSGAATLTVNASGGAMYLRIQDAIINATAGDALEVHPLPQAVRYFIKAAFL